MRYNVSKYFYAAFYAISLILFMACSPKNTLSAIKETSSKRSQINKKETADRVSVMPKLTSDTTNIVIIIDSLAYFKNAYSDITDMLENNKMGDFKRAVFDVENAYFLGSLDYGLFCNAIDRLGEQCKSLANGHLIDYEFDDSVDVKKNASIFKIITNKRIVLRDSNLYLTRSYGYDFDDPSGKGLYEHTFVSRLLNQNTGNCKSMSYLYKILAEELHTHAWLALAPMHIYIKGKSKKTGFYNTELTTAEFPSDVQIANSGYISTEAMVNSLYMDTLSENETLALCLYDLARAADKKVHSNKEDFVRLCLSKCLEYYPNFINALIFKARLSKLAYIAEPSETNRAIMERNYLHFLKLGYRKMPEENYHSWIKALELGRQQRFQPLDVYKEK